jgi:hypothetical protein
MQSALKRGRYHQPGAQASADLPCGVPAERPVETLHRVRIRKFVQPILFVLFSPMFISTSCSL